MMSLLKHYQAEFEKALSKLQVTQFPKIQTVREKQFANFLKQGFPERKWEDWKYTPLTSFKTQHFELLDQTQQNNLSLPSSKPAKHRIVFINGNYVSTYSHLSDLPKNVIICDLNTAFHTYSDQVQAALSHTENINETFINLNTAFMNSGLFLYVPKNLTLEPIELCFITDNEKSNQMQHIRNMIVIEENSHLNFLENHMNANEQSHFTNTVTQLIAKPNAVVNYYQLQEENLQTYHFSNLMIEQQKNSQVSLWQVGLGSCLGRNNVQFYLKGESAACMLEGLYMPMAQQYIDYHTRIDHCVSQTTSQERYKGILTDEGVGVFNGKVVIHPKAQKSQANQMNKNLLLAKTATINTKPELEIYADDVKCAHGATVGQLDEQQLFYLRSRGIKRADAIALLSTAFVQEILDTIPCSSIKGYLSEKIEQRLSQMVAT